jgi:hypothetical protein
MSSLIYSILIYLHLIAPNATITQANAAYKANSAAVKVVAAAPVVYNVPFVDISEVN